MPSSGQVSSELLEDQEETKSPREYPIPEGMEIAAILDSGRGDRTFVSIPCNTDWHTSPFFLLGLSMLLMC